MLETSLFVGILVFTSVWNFVLNLFTIMIWQINELVPTYSYKKNILCDHWLHDLYLYFFLIVDK